MILSTRKTANGGVSGTSTGPSGNISLAAANISIGTGAQLLSYDDQATGSGIPGTIGNQTTPVQSWVSAVLFNNLATTGGSGTGLTVNVTTDINGKPTAVISTPGSGYQVGDKITVAPPAGQAGSTFTFQIESLAGRIPATIGNQTTPAHSWAPNVSGAPFNNLATTGGSGTGLTVNVTTDINGKPTAVINASGFGYQVGDVITVAPPAGNTGSSFTFKIASLPADPAHSRDHRQSDDARSKLGPQRFRGPLQQSCHHRRQRHRAHGQRDDQQQRNSDGGY